MTNPPLTMHRIKNRLQTGIAALLVGMGIASALPMQHMQIINAQVPDEEIQVDLLQKKLTVRFIPDRQDPSLQLQPWEVSVSSYPEWVMPGMNDLHARLNESAVRETVMTSASSILPRAQTSIARNMRDAYGVLRTDVIGKPQAGYEVDQVILSQAVITALQGTMTSVDVPVRYIAPKLIVKDGDETLEMSLLSTGRSNFEGSPLGRAANVRKAHEQHLNGVAIPQGEEFSFNETMLESSGWHDAYVIVNGGDLALEPGGGICQAATTVFRAAALAGLPIVKRKNHSLYVTYYEEYGVGMDATIYPGKQDFTFLNDTPGMLLMLARTDGDDAYVELYGTDDGRSVTLDGPYFAATAPDDFTVNDKKLARNEIAWKHSVKYTDGTIVEDTFVSRYTAIPKTLHERYAITHGTTEIK